ncbi:protein of unknown function [Sinomicrobium oceani]|uniref:DUF4286 domain-containing protein n=1 Tax=Sinomicrobium oceani TaxID=1150368 RepID=A0A1K1N7A7_9FLAO|nr:DUF4286 family protein [Sinomicrobium oceani]SFW30222.1 protein of unknown function [Sinomicrobium oceani]
MYIYNITINIEESVHEEWLVWMKEIHIPDILATGKFSNARMLKVLVDEDMGGVTYSVQLMADSRDILEKYYAEDAERIGAALQKRFADKFVTFRTELEIISEH